MQSQIQCLFKTVLLAIFISGTAGAQSNGTIQLDVTARDHYTNTPLDSVSLAIFFEGALIDSAVTGFDGRASLQIVVTTIENPGELPVEFSLSNNYPNPFQTDTRVDLGVPEVQEVRLEIFNILGQRVAMQSLRLDPGRYALNMSMGHLPVGVYFLRIGGRDPKVEKMIKLSRSIGTGNVAFSMEAPSSGPITKPLATTAKSRLSGGNSSEGYQLRATRNRYRDQLEEPEIENSGELLVQMLRNNIITLVTLDPDGEPAERELRITGEQFEQIIETPETLVLTSGIYSVEGTSDDPFTIKDVFEIVSRDSSYIIRPFVSAEAQITGRVSNDRQQVVSGARVQAWRDGMEVESTTTDSKGDFSLELMADGSLYSVVVYPKLNLSSTFVPEEYVGFSPDARVITPFPGGSYNLNFLLYTENPLVIPGGSGQTPVGNYTLSTDGGTVMISNIPPELGIVGGSAQAYSPTITPGAFPGEFATRQDGLESALFSGGFASVNLLRSNGAGSVEPISELRDSTGTPVRVELRFRMDPLDYYVLRDPETLSYLPSYVNRPDTIDVPLYFYNEQLGDWILSPEFGWLESETGAIPFDQIEAIRDGSYEGKVYVTGLVDHFTFYNIDKPARRACVTGRILDQNFQPVPGAQLVLRSMPETPLNTFFSNTSEPVANQSGYFRGIVPRTETGPSDDWNGNNRTDFFRFNITYEDPNACTISYFDGGGNGYLAPFYPEESGCLNVGSLRVSLREAKEKDFKITFLDIEREGQPDYPLFTVPPATSGFNYATATLLDNRIPLMGPVWNCICDDGSAFQICNYQSTTDPSGRAEFTLPVLIPDPDLPLVITESLTGTFSYRKDRPDLGFGAYEFAGCNYLVPENQGSKTVRCEVERRGPPNVDIIRIATDDGFDEDNPFQLSYLFDDVVVIEAEGEDINESPIEIFYWTNPLQTRLVANGQVASAGAGQLFGVGSDLGIMVHGIDFYGWQGTDVFGGIEVEEVVIDIEANRGMIVPGDTTLVQATVTGANNTNVNWSVNNPGIATIQSSGILTAQAPGEVIITGRSAADPFKTDQVTVEIANLVANFTVTPTSGDSTTVFTFDGSPSLGVINLYEWDFGDGTTAQGEIVQHSYGSSGGFQATLTVTGQDGLKASSSSTVSTTGEPVAVISANPESGSPPLTVQFDGSGSFSDSGAIIDWAWDFGDGNQGAGEFIEHTFTEAGDYYTSLTVKDESGRTGVDSLRIVVSDGPLASFTVTPETGSAPLEVIVDASSSEGDIIRYSWDFGDGTILNSGSAVETNTYSSDGSYTIQLEVEDNIGRTDQSTRTLILGCDELFHGNVTIRRRADFLQLEGFCGVDGNLSIRDDDGEIDNLFQLSNLTSITGELAIRNSPNLPSLVGLNNISNVGSLRIENNEVLQSLSLLQNISGTIQDIRIENNPLLSDVDIFDNIVEVGNDVRIVNNPELLSLNTFGNLQRVERNFSVFNTNISHCEISDIVRELESRGGVGGNINILGNANELSGNPVIFNDGDVAALEGICAINGSLTIRNDAQNLAGLDSLRTVTGNLSVLNTGSLQSLQGLNNLSRVQTLNIRNNSQLTDISALSRLNRVNGDIYLWNSPIQDLGAFSNIRTANIFSLLQLPEIENLNGMESITVLENLIVREVPSLTSLEGIQNLQSVKYLTLRELPALNSEYGFDSLTKIGSVWLSDLDLIRSLSIFPQLTEIERPSFNVLSALEIVNLPALETLTHLQNIQVSDFIALRIENTPVLTSLTGLENITEFVSLRIRNADNLQSLEGLQNATTIGTLELLNLESLSNLNGLSGLESVSTLSLQNNPLFSGFTGLSNAIETNINFTIRNNPSLMNMTGLEWLRSAGSFNIIDNGSLVNLNGLESLNHLEGTLNIQNNQNLSSIEALSGLETLAPPGATKSINITQNRRLQSLKGLGNIQLEPDPFSPVHILLSQNQSVKNMEGLEFADFIGNLTISNNDSLLTLEGLQNLHEANTLNISQNSRLINTDDLHNLTTLQSLLVNNNVQLARISGMTALSRIESSYSVGGNISLPTCDAEQLRDQVLERDGIGVFIRITGNNDLLTCSDLSSLDP